jgi:hypothetical protein
MLLLTEIVPPVPVNNGFEPKENVFYKSYGSVSCKSILGSCHKKFHFVFGIVFGGVVLVHLISRKGFATIIIIPHRNRAILSVRE